VKAVSLVTRLAFTLCAMTLVVAAHAYPERPLRLVIPFPPGGGADNLARIVGVPVGERLGQTIVIDNRAGAGGNIAAAVVANAAPDGYTLLQANVSHAISTSLYSKLSYDLLKDFIPVTQLASIPFLLAVNPAMSVHSVKELIAIAKSKPGQLNYASSGAGGPSHLAMELFKSMSGAQIRHIPYKGAVPAATDLLAGRVDMSFFTFSGALPYTSSGRLRALGLASAYRSPLAPNLPTIGETGLPGFEATTWFGIMVPHRTPASVVSKLHTAFASALNAPGVRERLTNQGFEVVGSSQAEFAAYVKSEIPKWAKVVKASGATVE